jgi:AcrR family transcriptional regulator
MDTFKDCQTTEDIILAAAEQEFLDKGYSMTRMTEIARLAGVNHALLHYYYRSKDKLFATIFEKKMQEVIFSFLSVITQDLTLKEKIKAGVEAHFDFIALNPKLPFFIVNEFLTNTERVKSVRPILAPIIKELYNSFEKDLQKAIEANEIRPITSANLIYDIITLNICSFIVKPLALQLLELKEEEYQSFINQRKAENVNTILCRLGLEN